MAALAMSPTTLQAFSADEKFEALRNCIYGDGKKINVHGGGGCGKIYIVDELFLNGELEYYEVRKETEVDSDEIDDILSKLDKFIYISDDKATEGTFDTFIEFTGVYNSTTDVYE